MTSYFSKYLPNRKTPKTENLPQDPQEPPSQRQQQENGRIIPTRQSSDKSLDTIEVGYQYVSEQCVDAGLLWDIPSSKKSSSARVKKQNKKGKAKLPHFRLISNNRDSNTSLRTGQVGRNRKQRATSAKPIKHRGSDSKPSNQRHRKMSSEHKSKSMPSSGFLQERMQSTSEASIAEKTPSAEQKELPRRASDLAGMCQKEKQNAELQGTAKPKPAHVHTESRTDQSRVSRSRLQKIEEYKRQLESGTKPVRRKSTMNMSNRDYLWKESTSQPTPLEKSMGYAGVAPLLGGAFVKSFRKKSRSKSFTNTSYLPYDKNRSKAFAREVELDANSTDNENFVSDRESYFSYVSKKKQSQSMRTKSFRVPKTSDFVPRRGHSYSFTWDDMTPEEQASLAHPNQNNTTNDNIRRLSPKALFA